MFHQELKTTTQDASVLGQAPLGDPIVREEREKLFLKNLNRELSKRDPQQRLMYVIDAFGEGVFATVSGGIQSRIIPTLLRRIADEKPSIAQKVLSLPLVFLDTGDLFPESVEYVRQMKRDLQLSLRRVSHALSSGEFKLYEDALVAQGMGRAESFDWLTKVEPLKTFIQSRDLKVWIAGNRRDQASSRGGLPFVQRENGVLKFYPLADMTRAEINCLMRELDIPPHPLAKTFLSVGNVRDTRVVEFGEAEHEKDGRHESGRTECGLHTVWARRLLERGVPIREKEL